MSDRDPDSIRRLARVALVLLVGLGLLVAWRSGALARVGDVRALTKSVADRGLTGQLMFLAAYTLLQPFGVPGTVFVVAAPLIWPWPVAFALSMAGTMAASVVGFAFARFVARDWLAPRVPAWLRRYDAALEAHGFRTVFLLRLLFWMPQALHTFLGLSRVSFATHFWGSLLGYAPPLLAVSYFGSQLIDAEGRLQPMAWPFMGALLAFSVVVLLVSRWLDRRRARSSPIPRR
jgi:uncharacterized membrane protein YdjX (TVP38/TMEM64 family)